MCHGTHIPPWMVRNSCFVMHLARTAGPSITGLDAIAGQPALRTFVSGSVGFVVFAQAARGADTSAMAATRRVIADITRSLS
jgi:hypothetical protein